MTCAGGDPPERSPDQLPLLGDDMAAFRAVLGADLPVAAAVDALTRCSGDTERAIKWLLNNAVATDGGSGDIEPEKGRDATVVVPRGIIVESGIGGVSRPSPPPPLPTVKVEAADEGEVTVNIKREPVDADTLEAKVKIGALAR